MRKVHERIASLVLLAVGHAAMGQVSMSIQMNKPQDPVIGLPFSADQSVRTVQHLADGTPLTSELKGHVYRSAAGIERYDGVLVSSNADAATQIYILDRAKHTAVLLNTKLKTATIEHLPPTASVSIRFLPLRSAPIHGAALKPADMVTTDLGTRTQGTMILVGKHVVGTIAAGKVGNDQPLYVTTDVWVYPQLKLLVKEVEQNPLSGERTFELTNIRSEDPDPGLFEIPAGYTIKDMPPMPSRLPDIASPRPPAAPEPMTKEIRDALKIADPGTGNTGESSQWQQIVVDDSCRVLAPATGVFQTNPDLCRLDGMGVHRSSHVAAKETAGVIQHRNVEVAEQTYLLQNVHSEPVVFVVVQKVPDGWHIDSDPQPKAIKGDIAVFRANAEPGQTVRLHVGMAHETPLADQQ